MPSATTATTPLTRRRFLRAALTSSLTLTAAAAAASTWPRPATAATSTPTPPFPRLLPDPARILDLPPGFTYRVISRAGAAMTDGLRTPGAPDGMAAFPAPGGKIFLVRNHELVSTQREASPFGPNAALLGSVPRDRIFDPGRGDDGPCLGGTTTLLYDPATGATEAEFLSLAGTVRNCAGGATPSGTWITCEEPQQLDAPWYAKPHGWNFEVRPTATPGLTVPVPLRAMGRFNHEAVAIDPRTGIAYQTEDRADGLLYRFLPHTRGELAAGGKLQALAVEDRPRLDTRNWDDPIIAPRQPLDVAWIDLDDVESPKDDLRKRGAAKGAALFARGEGAAWGRDGLYFDCTSGGAKELGQVFRYAPSPHEGTAEESKQPGRLELFYESPGDDAMDGPDNLAIAPWGDVIACEDGDGDQYLLGVTPAGRVYRLARNAVNDTELAGATFSPDGKTLFLNLYGVGLTLAITGPWPSSTT